jgi:hypothetical protein
MEKLKQVVPAVIWDYTPVAVFAIGSIWVVKKVGSKLAMYISEKRLLRRWKNTPKDVVILHMIRRGRSAPSPSPFVLKLETYLRMANIPYQVDTEYPFGPTKKTPWITLNGQHIGDTHLIIKFLNKKFDKQIGQGYSPEQKALGLMARILIEEHIYWGVFLWRYYYRAGQDLPKVFSYPPVQLEMARRRLFALAKTATWYQGIGRHSKEDVIQIITDSLRALSLFIGDKKFLLGDEPCEDDCAVFGFIGQLIWCASVKDSPFDMLIQNELPNLIGYATRMREAYWPDWDKFIVK